MYHTSFRSILRPCAALCPCRAVPLGGGRGRPRGCATEAVVHIECRNFGFDCLKCGLNLFGLGEPPLENEVGLWIVMYGNAQVQNATHRETVAQRLRLGVPRFTQLDASIKPLLGVQTSEVMEKTSKEVKKSHGQQNECTHNQPLP